MKINIDCKENNSSCATKFIINKVLDIVDNHPTKYSDAVRKTILKEDETLIPIFNALIKKNAIICSSEKKHGKLHTVLSTANRNSIFYAIANLKDVYSIDDLKKWFTYFYESDFNSDKKQINVLKLLDFEESFSEYLNSDFHNFCLITDFCCNLYKEYERKQNRIPVPSPVPVNNNVVYISEYKKDDNNDINNNGNKGELKTMGKDITKKNTTTKTSKSKSSNIKKDVLSSKEKKTKDVKEKDKNNKTTVKSKATKNNTETQKHTESKNKLKQKCTEEKQPKNKNVKLIKITKKSNCSEENKLKNMNIKLSKSFSQFEKIVHQFFTMNEDIEDDICFVKLKENVKNNLDQVDKIRRELKKLSDLRQRFNKIKDN